MNRRVLSLIVCSLLLPLGCGGDDDPVAPDPLAPDPGAMPLQNQIVFLSARDGSWDIFVMNADGSDQVNLTSKPCEDRHGPVERREVPSRRAQSPSPLARTQADEPRRPATRRKLSSTCRLTVN